MGAHGTDKTYFPSSRCCVVSKVSQQGPWWFPKPPGDLQSSWPPSQYAKESVDQAQGHDLLNRGCLFSDFAAGLTLSFSFSPLCCDNRQHFFVSIFACAGLLDTQTDIQDHFGLYCADGWKRGFRSVGSGSNSFLIQALSLSQGVSSNNTGPQNDAPHRLDTNAGCIDKKIVF